VKTYLVNKTCKLFVCEAVTVSAHTDNFDRLDEVTKQL